MHLMPNGAEKKEKKSLEKDLVFAEKQKHNLFKGKVRNQKQPWGVKRDLIQLERLVHNHIGDAL